MPRHVFDNLPESTRIRLVASLRGEGSTRPLHAERTSGKFQLLRDSTLVLASALGLMSAASHGLGSPGHASAIQGGWWYLIWLGLGFLLVLGLAGLTRALIYRSGLPWPPGLYLLPHAWIDAREAVLEVLPLRDLVELRHTLQKGSRELTRVELLFPGSGDQGEKTLRSFLVRGHAQARAIESSVESAIVALHDTPLEREQAVRDTFEPLFLESTPSRPAARSGGPRARDVPRWLRHPIRAALLLGPVLGFIAMDARNTRSVSEVEARLHEQPTSALLDWYLSTSSSTASPFERSHRPQALYREAFESGSLAAMRTLALAFPESAEATRALEHVDRAHRDAEAALLRNISASDPNYVRALQALLGWLAESDSPKVILDIPPPDVSRLSEQELSITRRSPGPDSLPLLVPSPFFQAEQTRPHAQALAARLARAFNAITTREILELCPNDEHAAMSRRLGLLPGESERPKLSVACELLPSGEVFSKRGDPRRFLGVATRCGLLLRLPGQVELWSTTLLIRVKGRGEDLGADASGAAIYSDMGARLFDELGRELGERLFQKNSPSARTFSTAP